LCCNSKPNIYVYIYIQSENVHSENKCLWPN
jgi:hypothetical protein